MAKTLYITLGLILISLGLFAQPDTIYYEEQWEDTTPPLPRVAFHLQDIGLDWIDGNVQFFEGYDVKILYADARSGLPIYPDWGGYSRGAILPTYYQFGAHIALVDTVRGLKLRFSGLYSHREDSMNYSSDFHINDTIYGRISSEKGSFGSLGIAALKQTRKLLKFIRFHGGAELELGMSPTSKILFEEFAADVGEGRLVEYNVFRAEGKPRFLASATAILGLETVFLKHFGFLFEVKSGLGYQLVVGEKAFGMGRTTYHAGLNYYLFDYNRKALPRRLPEQRWREEDPQQPPTPEL